MKFPNPFMSVDSVKMVIKQHNFNVFYPKILFLVTFRNKLIGNFSQVFSELGSPDFASILWKNKNIYLKFDDQEVWFTESLLESMMLLASVMTLSNISYEIHLASKNYLSYRI